MHSIQQFDTRLLGHSQSLVYLTKENQHHVEASGEENSSECSQDVQDEAAHSKFLFVNYVKAKEHSNCIGYSRIDTVRSIDVCVLKIVLYCSASQLAKIHIEVEEIGL